ncbi:hypothetical protein IP84_08525 [beta proteobacterium AAP99]|nr:hypothetical protein IP84_08525 [beta proteobacterium AAP99]
MISHATRIFSVKGFAGASTREICDAAGVNLSAIRYYFGDKAGLYRAVLERPIGEMTAAFAGFDASHLSLEQAMRMLLRPFVEMSDNAQLEAQVMRLHLREMLEPSDIFREVVGQAIVPAHMAMCAVLARHSGAREIDDDIHQLAFALVAMAHDYCMSREFMNMLAPGVLGRPDAVERIVDRLVGYAEALVAAERARRRGAGANTQSASDSSAAVP